MTTTSATRIDHCPACHKPNVRRDGTRLIEVEEQAHWKRAYFRAVHTPERCAAFKAEFDASLAEQADLTARVADMNRSVALTNRYAAIYGREAVAANWERIAARWVS